MKPQAPLPHHEEFDITRVLQRTYKILRGNISYGNLDPTDSGRNIDIYPAKATTPGVINTEFSVAHGLNRIPVGFHVVNKSGVVDLYQSTTPWTTTKIYLKASVININVTLLIF
jgi:hypothetical protein